MAGTRGAEHPARVLTLMRAVGLLAPFAVLGVVVAAVGAAPHLTAAQGALVAAMVALGVVAGGTSMALGSTAYVTRRLNAMAAALEHTVDGRGHTAMRVAGSAPERRLASAFNAALGAFAQVEARATRDRLTGIANRESLLTTLSTEIENAVRHYRPLSLAFIDIDRFKPINDTYGHHAGDEVLRRVSSLISHAIRAGDTFGRYGGEEFMLILPETVPEDAIGLAEELRALVMREPLHVIGDEEIRLTISIGVAGGRGSQLQIDMLVDRADAAMYAAKSLGRNRTYLYRELDEDAPVRRAPISAEHRAQASAIGQWASDTATQALASVLAPQPHHRGRPSDMIASLATGIGLEMGLPAEEIGRIRIASLLHDLGKVAIPDEILDKPTALSDMQWQAIGEHPRIGQVILEHATALREAIPVVLHHHERYNGGGYPHGLAGNEIPLGARIVAVADAYHAMVSERPYKRPLSHAQALRELRQHAGTQFDPQVVDLFCTMYARGVPPDGLEEVQRLHERARGGLVHIDGRVDRRSPARNRRAAKSRATQATPEA